MTYHTAHRQHWPPLFTIIIAYSMSSTHHLLLGSIYNTPPPHPISLPLPSHIYLPAFALPFPPLCLLTHPGPLGKPPPPPPPFPTSSSSSSFCSSSIINAAGSLESVKSTTCVPIQSCELRGAASYRFGLAPAPSFFFFDRPATDFLLMLELRAGAEELGGLL